MQISTEGRGFLQQVSAQDAAFLYMESANNLTHVTGLSIYDPSTAPGGKVRFKDIIKHVESRIHVSPLFKRRLLRVPFELDYPYWVDDEYFDIEYHMRHGRLPEPGDWRQLCIHMARYHSRPLAMQRPLWEMFVVEGLDNIDGLPSGCYAIATKIHHVAVDGTSAVRFFAAMADLDAKGTPSLDISTNKIPASPEPDISTMMRRATVNNLTSPVRMLNTIFRSAPTIFNAAKAAFQSDDKDEKGVPETRFNKSVSPHKMFDATVFQLEQLKSIRATVAGATINDIVLAVCSGGLRRYLEFHSELPKASLVAWVPINARSRGGPANPNETPGNNITAMTAEIHTHIADPIARLGAIRDTTKQTKEAKAGVSARLMTDISRHIPSATQAIASRLILRTGLGPRVCNLFVSNVPGPQVDQFMNGARMVSSFGMAPLNDGMGLFIATPSYNGQITFGVTSTRQIMPDIEFFMECLRTSFDELHHAANTPEKPNKKKRQKRPVTRGAIH